MAKASATQVEVGGRSVRLSSPERVLWPEVGVTKLDLAHYMVAVGAPLIAAIGDRPVTLQRFPQGVEGEVFYSKNPPKGAPDWIRTVDVMYPSGRIHAQMVIDEVAGAVWAVQMNTIVLHPWPVRTGNTDNPDELRIDLDPQPGRDYRDAAEAAGYLRELLSELGLTGFVKTSGNRGVHVFARILPEYEFLDVRHATIGIGRELVRRHPDLVTMEWWKEERGERVFVDFNQANRDRTIAAAWSPRQVPNAQVSTPLTWDELSSVDPADLTVRTVPERLAAQGNPWTDMDSTGASLAPGLALWQADVDERGLGELPFPPDFPKMPGEPKRARPSVSREDTEGIPTENLYAKRDRWESGEMQEWQNRPSRSRDAP